MMSLVCDRRPVMHKGILTLCGYFLCSLTAHAATHHPQDFLNEVRGKPNEGRAIVDHFCANCHASNPLISVGAPRIGHPEDWVVRLKQAPDIVWQHTSEGWHAMPARGGCFECTDEQLKKAILELVGSKE